MHIKKLSTLFVSLICCSLSAEQNNHTKVGATRIIKIMLHGPQGIHATNQQDQLIFADVQNLTTDLNISAISQNFHCTTIIGKSFLEQALESPISPKDRTFLLRNRQQAIYTLHTNPELMDTVTLLLKQAQEQMTIIINCMQNKQSNIENLPNNSISLALYKSPLVQMIKQITWASIAIGSGLGLNKLYDHRDNIYAQKPYLVTTIESGLDDYIVNPMKNRLKQIESEKIKIKNLHEAPVKKGILQILAPEMIDNIEQQEKNYVKVEPFIKKSLSFANNIQSILKNISGPIRTTAYVTTAMAFGIGSYSLYQIYLTHIEGLKMRDSLHAFNRLIIISEQIEQICTQYNIKNQFTLSSITDENCLELINSLQSYIYTNNSDLFVPSSLTRTFMYTLYEQDMHLAPLFAIIGEMDSLHALTSTIMTSNNSFCFTHNLDQKQPEIQTNKFWNILVKNSVRNNLNEKHKIILTGPNAGGKSTTIRSILQNIVLGQTFGIAAAQKFYFTPFDVIHSFINVSDDILSGNSLFATEVKRAQEIRERINNLSSNEKYFFALDELFTGTNAEDGELCAYEFVKRITSYKDIMFIYATHFNKLKEIASQTDNCINYKIDAPLRDKYGVFIRDKNGKLAYPFTLSLGENNTSVAKEIAEQAGLFT